MDWSGVSVKTAEMTHQSATFRCILGSLTVTGGGGGRVSQARQE